MTKSKNKKNTNKRKKSKQQTLNYKLINIILTLIIILILALAYIIYTSDNKKHQEVKQKMQKPVKLLEKNIQKEIFEAEKKAEEELDKYIDEIKVRKDEFEEYTKDLYEEYVEKTEELKKELKDKPLKNNQEKKEENKKLLKVIDKPEAIKTNKPKLVIIFDDVTTQSQIRQIKQIGFRTNISIMPPTSKHPNSAIIAQDLAFYMIHFPLEAKYFKGEEKSTLHVGDSYEKIEKRVAQIRKWYPNAKYTNNHTGSKFTEDEQSMDYLFKALKKYDFVFMDSRTTSKTVAKQMASKYDMPYIVRNIFLDNEQNFEYIQKQLKKSINLAKKNGYAIAIGHPHQATIKTLAKSKHLVKDLELIYLNQLPFLNK